MKGIIFNVVESIVVAEHGIDVWDEVIDESGVIGAYTSLGTYPDSDLLAIATTVANRLGATPTDVVRHVGHQGISRLYERYPEFFDVHDDIFEFLLTLNSIIHPEVRKLYPGADVPDFDYRMVNQDCLELVYRSTRKRCDLAEGLILGSAEHFGATVSLSQPRCMLHDDAECVIRVSKI